MKQLTNTNFRRALFVFAALFMITSTALASINPVPGIDIIVKKKPGNIALHAPSDTKGNATFAKLKAGVYEMDLTKAGHRGRSKAFKPFYLTCTSGNSMTVNGKPSDPDSKITVNVDTTIEFTLREAGAVGFTLTADDTTTK